MLNNIRKVESSEKDLKKLISETSNIRVLEFKDLM
jgi:hypothetical protein